MEFGVLSIVPPLVAIILALITKEVISSLMLGIFAGGLIFTGGDILNTFQTIFELMGSKLGDNGLMIFEFTWSVGYCYEQSGRIFCLW